MVLTVRQDQSSLMAILQWVIKPFGALISKPGKPLPGGSPRLTVHPSASKTCIVTERQLDDIWIYDVTSRYLPAGEATPGRYKEAPSQRVVYVAGGSFCMPPSSDHWKFCAELARSIPDIIISVISPPLAPNSPAPHTIPHLKQLFKSLLIQAEENHETVTFAGDSSGANLVLTVVLEMLQQFPEAEAPDGILLISPVVDLSFKNPEIRQVQKRDPVLRLDIELATAKSWAASWDLQDPRVSPLYADISPLKRRNVKLHGILGGNDLLTPDAIKFQQLCDREGIEGEWLLWEKQMHCFPIAFHYHLPESVHGKNWVVKVLSRAKHEGQARKRHS